ncbi:hypothetical protein F4703DRAFT_1817484 [Phycomyces blakesleeanus]
MALLNFFDHGTLRILVLCLVLPCVLMQSIENPTFWQQPIVYNISDVNDPGQIIEKESLVARSDDFQVLYPGNDPRAPVMAQRILFDFSYSCLSTNISFDSIQKLNNNTLTSLPIRSVPKIAMIQRGHCGWSEKISVLQKFSEASDLNVKAILIYDNITYDGTPTYALHGNEHHEQNDSSKPLPAERNVYKMADNNIQEGELRIPIYFAPNKYGVDIKAHLEFLNSNNTKNIRKFIQLTPFFGPVPWTMDRNASNNFGTALLSTHGYLAYIVALASAFFIGIVILRWWRFRKLRTSDQNISPNDSENEYANHTQNRQETHPLAVEIVNGLPIKLYTAGIVKNTNCAICLEDFEEDKHELRILPCHHGFCVMCIDQWLTQKSTFCPICKWDCEPSDCNSDDDDQDEEDLGTVEVLGNTMPHEAIEMRAINNRA